MKSDELLNRGGAEARINLIEGDLTQEIIGAAIEVHRHLGPGLLESAYEECLCHELKLRKIAFQRQLDLPVSYKGVNLACGYRIDLLIENLVIAELKCVERLLPVHDAQLLTYMKLASKEVGFLFNFHTEVLTRGGVVRKALSKPAVLCASAPPR
jgi:GxxExxY protein